MISLLPSTRVDTTTSARTSSVEAGHAVAALMLGDEVLEVRINARAVMAGKADLARTGRYVG
jgi:hypothetical protein